METSPSPAVPSSLERHSIAVLMEHKPCEPRPQCGGQESSAVHAGQCPQPASPQHCPQSSPVPALHQPPRLSPQGLSPLTRDRSPVTQPPCLAVPVGADMSSSPPLSCRDKTHDIPATGKVSNPVRQNSVSTVMLHGVPIVSLHIDGQQRLCLAQISNTLLKEYSYNEIHNRRVALGITCVQCTPVQLEILRRAGAMPISSRRCGMITKREAERLVKSFLEDLNPPKLPENFAFDVSHDCGWGGRGEFIPSRYNSSRAKCIKCSYCNMFFSPNKFIFHFHRTPESKYQHPDAANFNSWRRHLKLTSPQGSDDIVHLWEDVKAMFNGGSRKRILSSSSSSSSSHHKQPGAGGESPRHEMGESPVKRQRLPGEGPRLGPERARLEPGLMPPTSVSQHPSTYPMFPMTNKLLPLKTMPSHPAFSMPPYHYESKAKISPMKPPPPPPNSWNGLPESLYPPYEMIWAKHLGLSPLENGLTPGPKLSPRSVPVLHRHQQIPAEQTSPNVEAERFSHGPSDQCEPSHASAFRPVGNRQHQITPLADREIDLDVQEEGHGVDRDGGSETSGYDESENVDVDTLDEEAGGEFDARDGDAGEEVACQEQSNQEEENNNDNKQEDDQQSEEQDNQSHDNTKDCTLSPRDSFESNPPQSPQEQSDVLRAESDEMADQGNNQEDTGMPGIVAGDPSSPEPRSPSRASVESTSAPASG